MSEAKPMILLVDDEACVLRSIKRVLYRETFDLHLCHSGSEALNFLAQNSVDVIVSDMRMPEITGAELLQQVATRWPNTVRILLTGYADMRSTVAAINEGKLFAYIKKPWVDKDLIQTLNQAWDCKRKADEKESLFAKSEARLKEAHYNLQHQHMSSIKVMSTLLESRTTRGAGHSREICEFALTIGEYLGLNEEEQETLYYAAMVHDIGLIALPDQILETPYHRLHAKDKTLYQQHSIWGEQLLCEISQLQPLAEIIRYHHECYDGSGYPDGLVGDTIPICSQILSVVSDYDDLMHGRYYSRCFSSDEAQHFMIEQVGKRYSRTVVRAAIEGIGRLSSTQRMDVSDTPEKSFVLGEGVLDEDIFDDNGLLLLAKGAVIDQRLLDRLQNRLSVTQ